MTTATRNDSDHDDLDLRIQSVFLMGMLSVVVGMVPLFRWVWTHGLDLANLDRWVWLLAIAQMITTSVCFLLATIPSHRILRVTACWFTVVAAGYALLLAVFSFAGPHNTIIMNMDLSDAFTVGHGLQWIGVMAILSALIAVASHWIASAK